MEGVESIKWPAIAFQSIFLAIDIAFLLHGKYNIYVVASLTLIVFLFIIQIFSKNPRFLYLFPINATVNKSTPGIDTWILKISLIASAFLFYVGAVGSLIWALILLVVILIFPFVWKKYLEPYNDKLVESIIKGETGS